MACLGITGEVWFFSSLETQCLLIHENGLTRVLGIWLRALEHGTVIWQSRSEQSQLALLVGLVTRAEGRVLSLAPFSVT